MQGGKKPGEAKNPATKNPISTIVLISGFGMHFCSVYVLQRGKNGIYITTSYDQIIQ